MNKFLLFTALLATTILQAQCGMEVLELEERIIMADLVIEGQVIGQETFEPDGGSMILTKNTIEITKVFKTNLGPTPSTIDIITRGGVLGLKADKVTGALELFKNDKGVFTLKTYQNNTYQAIAGSQSFIAYSQADFKAYSATKIWENIDTSLFNEITAVTGGSFQRVANLNFNYAPSLSKLGTVTVSSVSPLNINAGVGDVITITGMGFGTTQGSNLVVFANADTGGSLSLVPDNTQIEFWSDTEVRVQVPSGAGNGPVAILIDQNNNDISTQQLIVGYNHVNFTFALNNGTSSSNVVAEVSLTGENGAGGYNFDYAASFANQPDASATLDDIFEKWRCSTGVNFVRGSDLAIGNSANTNNPQTSPADNINVIKFDGSDLPGTSNILAFVLTRSAGCVTNNSLVAYVLEMDVVVNDAINWHYRDGSPSSAALDFNEFDFESVMLHEIGHAQQLGHVIDPSKVMHFSVGPNSMRRSIDIADIQGGNYINNKSVNIAPCGESAMQHATCDFIYSNAEWSPINPSSTFNPNSTITIENGSTSFTQTITKDITVDSGATLASLDTDQIAVNGNIVNNGTASFNQIIFAGATPKTISGNEITINEIDLLNTVSLNLNTTTNVTERLNNDGGTINTNNNLILKSDANGTAHVDAFEGTINGDVIVERYYPSRRAFRLIGPSVTTTSSIFENWQNAGIFTPGIGTHITGSTTGANGFDTTGSGNSSLFLYDNTGSNGWSAVSSTNNPADIVTTGNAYRLFVRGDRDPSLISSISSNSTTLLTKGTLATGTTSGAPLSSVAGAFGFIGNPYQAPVNMENVLTRSGSNLVPSYYVWDPNLNTRGAYVTINTVTDASSNVGSPVNKFAQPFQAFFVQTASNAPASIDFMESDKALTQGNLAVNSVATMRLSAVLKSPDTPNVLDGFSILFDHNFSNGITLNDSFKFTNLDETIATAITGSLYSIQERELPLDSEVIDLHHSNYRFNSYTYSFSLSGATLNTYLVDRFNNTRVLLNNNATTNVSFTVDLNDPISAAADRFSIEFSNITLSTINTAVNVFEIYPNPSNGDFIIQLIDSNKATVEIFNLLGQHVYTTELEEGHYNTVKTTLSSGNYILKLSQNGTTATQKIIIN